MWYLQSRRPVKHIREKIDNKLCEHIAVRRIYWVWLIFFIFTPHLNLESGFFSLRSADFWETRHLRCVYFLWFTSEKSTTTKCYPQPDVASRFLHKQEEEQDVGREERSADDVEWRARRLRERGALSAQNVQEHRPEFRVQTSPAGV